MSETRPDIAIHLHCFFNGGIEQVTINLIRSFIDRGLKVDLVLNFPGLLFLWKTPPELRVIDLKAQPIYKRLSNLVRYLRQEQPKALLSANHYANEVALLAKRVSGVSTKVVVIEQTTLSREAKNTSRLRFRHWAPLAARLVYPSADSIITVSQGVTEDLVNITGLPKSRFQIIYNPVVTPEQLKKAKEPVAHPWFAPGELPVVIGAGRLEKQKNFPNLITAFAKVRQVRPARLVIFGDGSLRSQLQELIHELGLDNDVEMPGFVENIDAYLSKSAVFVLSSDWEGLPTILIQALAVGTPVVSTDCPSGPSEILDNGKYGELVRVNDSEALAEKILNVLSGKSKLVDSAWLSQFTLENVCSKYLDLLNLTENLKTKN